jgi:branched-chain amino acid transport system permease protein
MQQFDTKSVVALLLVGVVFCVLPLVLPGTMMREITRLVVFAGSAMTLNLLVGTTGLISMGQGLFFGGGAYVVAIGTIKYGIPYSHTILLGLALTIPLSLAVALISLRTRHLFFGLLTLAIGQVAFVLVARSYELTGGDDGLVGVPVPSWLDADLARHFLAVAVLVGIGLVLLRLQASPFGTMLAAVRDNADRVASLGGNPRLYEIMAMMITGVLGTVLGIVSATTEGNVDPGMFSWTTSAMLLMMVALGGRSIFLGPILGTVILELSRAYVQTYSPNSDFVVGLIVIGCALVFPEGMGRSFSALAHRLAALRGAGDGVGSPAKAAERQS